MKKPRRVLENCRNQTDFEIDAQRVDRKEELRRLRSVLLRTSGNAFVYGVRGTGKTFLLRMLESDINRQRDDVFTFFFPLDIQLACASTHLPEASAFPVLFLLSMISCVWRQLMQGSYRDLVLSCGIESKALRFEEDRYKAMRDLHRAAFFGPASSEHGRESGIGVTALLKGEIKEKWTIRQEGRLPISVDIHQHVEDLRHILTHDLGITKVIGLCDEANLLPDEWQKHIIGNHIRVFSDQAIQFVFVAGYVPELHHLAVPDFFDAVIELKGLPRGSVFELFDRTIVRQGFRFEESAFEQIFSFSQGIPRVALNVAWNAATISAENNDGVISKGIAQRAIAHATDVRRKFTEEAQEARHRSKRDGQ